VNGKFRYAKHAQTGWRTYRRPDDKSGGHGVGWSPIIPYLFSVPQGWEEVTFYSEELNARFLTSNLSLSTG
jgi:hypothetical protein